MNKVLFTLSGAFLGASYAWFELNNPHALPGIMLAALLAVLALLWPKAGKNVS